MVRVRPHIGQRRDAAIEGAEGSGKLPLPNDFFALSPLRADPTACLDGAFTSVFLSLGLMSEPQFEPA